MNLLYCKQEIQELLNYCIKERLVYSFSQTIGWLINKHTMLMLLSYLLQCIMAISQCYTAEVLVNILFMASNYVTIAPKY